ncbi:MAG TPA: sugar ABC transporter ATP-binding protein [Actinobacteria bacterium]|nr:sugar ABC transporter ATP-binding protein [Actinomycetota bacterium]
MVDKNEYILEATGIKKHFGGVYALDDVDLKLKHNEILGIVGDNGAGKSTLIKIISGALKRDDGEMYFNGKKVKIDNPKDAHNLGIETVYQNLGLVDLQDPSVNIFLGREECYGGILKYLFLMNNTWMHKETKNLMDKLKVDLGNLRRPIKEYSGGQRQAVAISKAAYWGSKVVILDEPTAALGVNESKKALELIKLLKENSHMSVIIISHNMQHVFSIVDRIMVLRRGKLITVQDIHDVTATDVIKHITGAEEIIERV